MSKTPEKLDVAISMVREENETALFSDEYQFVKKFLNRKRIVIVSERHLFYYSKKQGNLKKFNIHKIISITIDKKQIILDFKFHKQLKILITKETEESQQKFLDTIYLVIQHLLSNSELEKIVFNFDSSSKLCKPAKLTSIPSYYGAFCRFELSLEDFLFEPTELDEIKIRFLLLFHRKLADFTAFKNENNASRFLLEVLPLCPSIKYISIKQFGDCNIFRFLCSYSDSLSAIESISVDGRADDKGDELAFADFIDLLKSNLNSKLVALTFKNSALSVAHLDALAALVTSRPIAALEFHSAFQNKTVFDHFTSSFLHSISQCSHFTSLCISGEESADAARLAGSLPKSVRALATPGCGIPAASVLAAAAQPGLSVVDASHAAVDTYQNFARLEAAFSVPSLAAVVLDSVTFPFGSLQPFVRALVTGVRDGADISLAHIIASDGDLDKLDATFVQLQRECGPSRVRRLVWDFNPVSQAFVAFIAQQAGLAELSVSGCFSPGDENCFDVFCEFVAGSSLERLVCRRYDQICLESLTAKLIDAVAQSGVSFLDISHSRGGSACFQHLKDLVASARSIRELVYDGLEPAALEELEDFLLFARQHACMCSFPVHDVEHLYKLQKAAIFDIARIVSHCELSAGDDYVRPLAAFYSEQRRCFPFFFSSACLSLHAPCVCGAAGLQPYDDARPGFFFGSFIEDVSRRSYSKKDPCIFSFPSEGCLPAGAPRAAAVTSMKKHKNSRPARIVHTQPKSDAGPPAAREEPAPPIEAPAALSDPPVPPPTSDARPVQTLDASGGYSGDAGSYGSDYSSDEVKIPVKKKSEVKPVRQIRPVRGGLRQAASPARPVQQPRKAAPALADSSGDYSYSYGYSDGE